MPEFAAGVGISDDRVPLDQIKIYDLGESAAIMRYVLDPFEDESAPAVSDDDIECLTYLDVFDTQEEADAFISGADLLSDGTCYYTDTLQLSDRSWAVLTVLPDESPKYTVMSEDHRKGARG